MDTNTLANALKSVFGNNTTDNPSSSSKIPYCGSDGLPAGLASMGNLASVLGAQLKINLNTSEYVNSLYNGIGFKVCTSDSQTPNSNGNLFYVGNGSHALQLFCYNYADANLFWYRYRTNGAWGNWISLK